MANSKKSKVKDLKAHFFMSIGDGKVHTVYDHDNDEAILAAAFASAMMDDTELFNIISAAFITLLEEKEKKDLLAPLKEKYSSKTAKKPVKKTVSKPKK